MLFGEEREKGKRKAAGLVRGEQGNRHIVHSYICAWAFEKIVHTVYMKLEFPVHIRTYE